MRAFLHNLLKNPREPVEINSLDQFTLTDGNAEYFRHFDPRPLTTLSEREIMALRPKVQELLTRTFPDSVFVKTHQFLGEIKGMPLIRMDYTAGAIYIVRNPLDLVISYANHFGVTVDEAIEAIGSAGTASKPSDRKAQEYFASWSLHVKSWTQTKLRTLHVVRYEDLQLREYESFEGVAQFLGLEPPRERLERAISNSSFWVLQAQEKERGFAERSEHTRFFREGRFGAWKSALSREQVRQIVSDHREEMEHFGYVPEGY